MKYEEAAGPSHSHTIWKEVVWVRMPPFNTKPQLLHPEQEPMPGNATRSD